MTVSSVAHNIDEDIFLEFLSVGNGYPHTLVEDVWFIAIDMDNWCIHSLCYFCAVVGWPTLIRICSKTDLIVEDYMNYSSSAIVNQVLEPERLPNDSLASNCCITMNHNT